MQFTKLTRHACGWALGSLLLTASSLSHATTFSFTASGFGVSAACTSGDCVDVFTIGDADDVGNTIASSWSQLLNFTLTPSTGAVSGTWSLNDYSASLQNDLSGTFTGQWTQLAGGQAQLTLSYVVTTGGGAFDGYIGTGTSVLVADADLNYTETGSFDVTPVPEPASLALWLAGLGATALVVKRRRG
jgi:hypothetical protein